MGACRDTRARDRFMGASKAALISAACHSERFQAQISVSAYERPFYGQTISRADHKRFRGCSGTDR
jgi:hypothetical protein